MDQISVSQSHLDCKNHWPHWLFLGLGITILFNERGQLLIAITSPSPLWSFNSTLLYPANDLYSRL